MTSIPHFTFNDPRNVIDRFKGYSTEDIKAELKKNQNPFAVLMVHLNGDFNISCVLRSCNAFNGQALYYYGRKKIDRRGALGTYFYSDLIYLPDLEQVKVLKSKYKFVALEQTPNAVDLRDYNWSPNSCIVVGEESCGLQENILELCDDFVEVKQMGSVRSMNVAVAASIAMYDFMSKVRK